MSADGLDDFEEEFPEVREQLERIAQRQRFKRALEVAELKAWTKMLQMIEVEDSEFADFLRLHPELG